MYRHSPLMRSLLSQSQTPTAPRRAVGFFRSGGLAGCPARLITQSTSGPQILFRCPFQPSTEITLTEKQKTSTQTIGAIAWGKLCITENANGCWVGSYPQVNRIVPVFTQTLHSAGADSKMMKGNQIIVLTVDRDGRILQGGRNFGERSGSGNSHVSQKTRDPSASSGQAM